MKEVKFTCDLCKERFDEYNGYGLKKVGDSSFEAEATDDADYHFCEDCFEGLSYYFKNKHK